MFKSPGVSGKYRINGGGARQAGAQSEGAVKGTVSRGLPVQASGVTHGGGVLGVGGAASAFLWFQGSSPGFERGTVGRIFVASGECG